MRVPSINAGVGVCVYSSVVVGGCVCVAVVVVDLFRRTFIAACTAAIFIASSHIPLCVCNSIYRKESLVTITIITYICVLHC